MEFDFDPAEIFPNIKVKVTKRYIPTDEVMRYTFYGTWNYSKFNEFMGWTEWF